jgi:maltose alpha-D-glucosyltransferase/alpha-amylase
VPADTLIHAAIVDALPSLLVGVDWRNVMEDGTRLVLERQALREFLQRQRWFSSKAREIRHARFTDWTALTDDPDPAFLTIASVEYADGWSESYLVPLSLVSGEAAERVLKQSPSTVLARITGPRKGAIADAVQSDDMCDRMLGIIGHSENVPTKLGRVQGLIIPNPRFAINPQSEIRNPQSKHRWRRESGDQSNSVAFADDRFVLKLFRRIEPAPNPEFEIGRFLTERGFARTPPIGGALQYLRAGLEPGTLAIVQAAAKHQGSGWDYTRDDLRSYYERVVARVRSATLPAILPPHAPEAPTPFFTALEHWYLQTAATLGRRTAELHATLAEATDPAFAPEPLDRAALERLAEDMRAHATTTLDTLGRCVGTLNGASRVHAGAVFDHRAAVLARFDQIRGLDAAGWRIRVHGDYHLGQVLRTEEDFVILDFEGEPARPLEERRAKQSPLKDLAGMARSYSYAAYAALLSFTTHAPDDYTLLEPWAEGWQHWAAEAFFGGYATAIGDRPLAPSQGAWRPLLAAFTLDKALYELGYELNNRPDWVRIPLMGIRTLIT